MLDFLSLFARRTLAACLGTGLVLAACTSKPSDPNTPPTLSPIGNKTTLQGDLLTFGVTAQGDGAWPSLSTSALPTGASFTDHLDGSGTFQWTPSALQVGAHQVIFRATLDGLADSENVLIQVNSAPPPPPSDTVFITVDTVAAGDTAVVQMILVNPDSAVAGISIWLRAKPGILFDTGAPLLPHFPADGEWLTGKHDSIQTMSLLVVDFTPPLAFISPGRGPIFELRFRVSPSQAPGTYSIDTTNAIVPRGLDMSYRSGVSVPVVGFVAGQIVVQ